MEDVEVKLIDKPRVYCVWTPRVSDRQVLKFLEDEGFEGWGSFASRDADFIPEFAGRVCYMSFDGKGREHDEYIAHIKEVGHGSVLEHSSIGLLLTGVSRSLTHELVRHRAGLAFSQLSQRYVDESNVAFVVSPRRVEWRDSGDIAKRNAFLQWVEHRKSDLLEYREEVERLTADAPPGLSKLEARKSARETARDVLPNCTETKIVVTANVRAWRHFLEMRGSLAADAEIRRLTLAVLPELKIAAPSCFIDYEVRLDGESGRRFIHTETRKV